MKKKGCQAAFLAKGKSLFDRKVIAEEARLPDSFPRVFTNNKEGGRTVRLLPLKGVRCKTLC